MARSRTGDKLMASRFLLADATPNLSFTLAAIPWSVFHPAMGFATCSMPALTAKVEDISPLNQFGNTAVVTGHTVNRIRATRGATFYESDLSRWFARAQHGFGGPRRDMVLIQMMGLGGSLGSDKNFIAQAAFLGLGAGLTAITQNGGTLLSVAASVSAQAALNEGAIFIPAKAWLLRGCIPTEYKPGSDFDASTSAISIEEIEFAPRTVDEISLT